jgi:hypothetical protein
MERCALWPGRRPRDGLWLPRPGAACCRHRDLVAGTIDRFGHDRQRRYAQAGSSCIPPSAAPSRSSPGESRYAVHAVRVIGAARRRTRPTAAAVPAVSIRPW